VVWGYEQLFPPTPETERLKKRMEEMTEEEWDIVFDCK
jgi:hypothetical protein